MLAGVSIGMKRVRQQNDRALAGGHSGSIFGRRFTMNGEGALAE